MTRETHRDEAEQNYKIMARFAAAIQPSNSNTATSTRGLPHEGNLQDRLRYLLSRVARQLIWPLELGRA